MLSRQKWAQKHPENFVFELEKGKTFKYLEVKKNKDEEKRGMGINLLSCLTWQGTCS